MAIRLKIPKSSVSAQEGTISEWKVGEGDRISVGQQIYVLETEKTSLEIESPVDGVISNLAPIGEPFPVGHEIAVIEQAK